MLRKGLTRYETDCMKSSTGILTIDLTAIQANWSRINRELEPAKTTSAAVIKANAYGLGAAQVGVALYGAGCREFFLATLEEALAARNYLPADATIYVLSGAHPGLEDLLLQKNLIPVLFTLVDVQRWCSVCTAKLIRGACAIKVNTGMTRMGLEPEEFTALLGSPDKLLYIRPLLIMSHLACADEPDHPLNRQQLARFCDVAAISKKILPEARLSLANSSGIFLGREWHFDMVRPGASLYGINPQPLLPSPVLPVVQLDLPILQIRQIQESAGLGYGADVEVHAPQLLAVVAGGYADGLHRTIGRQGLGMCMGRSVPVLGRISMDTTIFNISSLSPELLQQGALMIQVLNKDPLTVDLMMRSTSVLGYEVLTSLGARYQRRYLLEGEVMEDA